MLNKLTESISNKMINMIKLFFVKYWSKIKRKINLTIVDIRLLHYISHNKQNKEHDKSQKIFIP